MGHIAGLERSFQMLTELARSADGRMDTHQSWINALGEAQANADARIAALADAQIRTEDIIREGRSRADEAFARLADAQAHTDKRLDALIDINNNGRKA